MSNKYSSKIRWVERNKDISEHDGSFFGFRVTLAESHTAFGRLLIENTNGEYCLWQEEELVVRSCGRDEIFRLADAFVEESARRLIEAISGSGMHGSPTSVVDYVRESHARNGRPFENSVTQ